LNSGRLTAPDVGEIYLQGPNDFQPIEGVAKSRQESDLPIVVRDGNTDHTAKDQAGMQRGQSTHARGRKTLDCGVSRTLSALGTKAGKEPRHRFRGLARLLDRQMLREAFRRLKRKAAPGIDGVDHAEYAKNLEGKFTFLGFDFFWGKCRHNPNYWRVRRVTNAKKFRNGLKALKNWLKKSRSIPLPEIIATLKNKLRGVWNYYGVIGNSERNGRFAWFAQLLVYKWLNRRSQRRSYNMTAFMEAWARWEIPMPSVVEKPWPQARQATQSTI